MTAPATTPVRHRRRRRRIFIALLIFALLILLLPLISLGSYHRTIADSLSRSLGHTVNIGSINLALFPFPGLQIHDLTVQEDPAFGDEPLLIAPTVTVYPQVSSLFTLRLEISRIDLDNASVNLVRDPSGRWNFSSLLLQASRTQAAPTAQRRLSTARRFPYVDFSGARINFKQGYEKKPFALLNTDASVWESDSNHWRIRLKAQPARTDLDLDLGDAGTVRLDGTLTRAASLAQLPVDLQASWTGAQLGQVSRLVFGFDSGWRGDLRLEAEITGDMESLKIHPRLHVINAHRLEFAPLNELDIDAFCDAMYHHPAHSLDHLICLLPAGSGHLLLTGSIPDLGRPKQSDLHLEINHTPASIIVSILGMLRRTLPTDLNASGDINGDFTWASPTHKGSPHLPLLREVKNVLTGHAVASSVSVHLADVDQPFTFPSLLFATPNWTPPSPSHIASQKHERHVSPSKHRAQEHAPRVSLPEPDKQASSRNIILLHSATFSAGAPTPMQVSAEFSRSAFSLRFTGDASLARLHPLTHDFAQLAPMQFLAPKGTVQTDLTVSGSWLPATNAETGAVAAESQLHGFGRLQHAQLTPAWLPEPIDIVSATVQFGGQPGPSGSSNTITWANAVVSVNKIIAKGSASYPAECDNPSGCAAEINLDFASLDAAALQSAIYGPRRGAFLQSLLSQVESSPPPWPPIAGTFYASTFTLGPLTLTNARAAITIKAGKLSLDSLDAATLGGSAHATGTAQNTSDGPAFALNLTWTGVKLPELAAIFHEKWGTGSIDGQSALKLHGFSSLADSATGTFSWNINGPWYGAMSGSTSATSSVPSPESPSASPASTSSEVPATSATASSSEARPSGSATPPAAATSPDASAPTTVSSSAPSGEVVPARQLLPLHLPLARLYPKLNHWSASGTIASQTLTFTRGPTDGTITFGRKLDLDWQSAPTANHHAATKPPLDITGTLAHPLIDTRAAKPPAPAHIR
jgi:hypothetical protein